MEHILVSMDIRQAADISFPLFQQERMEGFLGAVYRAIHLAERIHATVHILLVLTSKPPALAVDKADDMKRLARKHLDLMIEKARSIGITVYYYMTIGDFETEIIRFVAEHKITMLILGLPNSGAGTAAEFQRTLCNIRQNIRCTIELVRRKEPLTTRR